PTTAKLRISAGLYSFIKGRKNEIEPVRLEALRAQDDEFKEAISRRKRIVIEHVIQMHYIVRMKNETLQIRIEPELTAIIERAVQRTGLSKSEVLRQGLRKGVPEVIRALESPPRRTLVDALLEMKGLEIPE